MLGKISRDNATVYERIIPIIEKKELIIATDGFIDHNIATFG